MLDRAAVKQYQPSDIYPVWEDNRWDGMISGFATYADRERLVHLYRIDQGIDPTGRVDEEGEPIMSFWSVYVIRTITPEQAAAARTQYKLFQRYVGTHCDYDGRPFNEAGRVGSVRRNGEHQKFYEARKHFPKLRIMDEPIEGWFEMREEY